MLFSSIPFLYYFLPAVIILYFLAPRKLKNGVLLLSSLVFYGWGEPRYLLLMVFTILQGYLFGRLLEGAGEARKKKLLLGASCLVSLGLLAYFKYAGFFLESVHAVMGISVPALKIALPVGISFYTFQILSYEIDVYRGTVPAQRNIVDLGAYIAMFPQLIAGPIVRYRDIAMELKERRHSLEAAAEGTARFLVGLGKKVILANSLGELVTAFQNSGEKSVLFYWVYAIAFTLQIYFDFSGYSDMAIGLGRIFGFSFPENFNYPYLAGSITEFWRRWHMTLGGWFRDYLYIPLGGNRVEKWKWVRNILVVWLATGLWHGAAWNFVLWGRGYGLLLLGEKCLWGKGLAKCRVLNHIYVMFSVTLGFVLFNADGIREGFSAIGAMFGGENLPGITGEILYYLRSYAGVLVLGALGATPLPKKLAERVRATRLGGQAWRILAPLALTALLLVCTAYLVDGSYNPFLYFRF